MATAVLCAAYWLTTGELSTPFVPFPFIFCMLWDLSVSLGIINMAGAIKGLSRWR